MITTLLLLLCLGQTLLLLQINRKRLGNKLELSSLRSRLHMLEERLRERTEKWRISSETHDLATRRHEQTTALLNETKEYLNSIINSMPSMLIGVTPSGYVTHWNRATEQATSLRETDALGYRVDEVYPHLPLVLSWIKSAIEQGTPQTHESVSLNLNDETHYFDITVFPLIFSHNSGAVIRIDDVTLRVRLENMMIQNEKMLSLGELAAGMAHEINNPLAAIVQSAQNIQRRLSQETPRNHEIAEQLGLSMDSLQSYLQEREIIRFLAGIQEAGTRAATIVRTMLEFSRGSSRMERSVDINTVIRHALEFCHNSLLMSNPEAARAMEVSFTPNPELPLLTCNSTEIQQVIVNLIKNAGHAVRNVPSGQQRIEVHLLMENNYVRIDVSDNGSGMSRDVRQHIFDPFFTTKEIGEGTGLGLSIAYFIITERHKGRIDVDSTEGQGTTFSIFLPAP